MLRLKCPACQTLIETTVEDESRVTLQCAACAKQFTAVVPPRNRTAGQNPSPAKPAVAARPVASRPVAAKPVAARAVGAQPAPAYPPAQAPVDPLFDLPTTVYPAAAYQPVRRRKPIDLIPYLKIGGSIFALLMALGLGLFVWRWAANTDWSTFSLIRDTDERLVDEWCDRAELSSKQSIEWFAGSDIDTEKLKATLLSHGAWAEAMVVRSVRLGKNPLDKKPAFTARHKAIVEQGQAAMKAKIEELTAARKQPGIDNNKILEMFNQTPEIRDAAMALSALSVYMDSAFFDLPAPTNEAEKIYYMEADLVHDYLKQLAAVRTVAQSKAIAVKIEALADKMMDLATRRSKLPASPLERVPRDYVEKDAGFEAAEKVLVKRIRRDASPDETLKDAVANFNDARDLLIEASTGKSDVNLRSRFAEFRKIRSENTLRAPGDLFHDAAPTTADREMVFKPRREAQPDPVREAPQVVSNLPAQSPSSRADVPSMVESKPLENQPIENKPIENKPSEDKTAANNPPAASPAPKTSQPDLGPPYSEWPKSARDSFFRGLQAGMQGGRPGGAPGAVGANPGGDAGANPGGNPGANPGGAPVDKQPVIQPTDGSIMVMPKPPAGFPDRRIGEAPGPELSQAESVTIIVNKSSLDGNELVKRLASSLQSNSWTMNGSNGRITMKIKYSGTIDRVVKLIDFGTVTSADEQTRTIFVLPK